MGAGFMPASTDPDARTVPGAPEARASLRAALLAHRRPPLAPVMEPRGLGPYRGYGEVLAAIERLVDRGARLAQIGRSVKGEPLFAIHLGSDDPAARTAVTLS